MKTRTRRAERGAAVPEMLVTLPLLVLVLAVLGQVAAVTWTKLMVDAAAFAAARSVTTLGWPSDAVADPWPIQVGYVAAAQVTSEIRWSRNGAENLPEFPLGSTFPCPGGGWSLACATEGRQALTVTFRAPLARPLFNGERIRITAAAPYVIQHAAGDVHAAIPNEGDNATP